MNSNFAFLAKQFQELEKLGRLAEGYLYSDPNTCIYKLGAFAETIVNYMFDLDDLNPPPGQDNTLLNKLKVLRREDLLPRDIEDLLQTLRKKRNKAVHENYDSFEDCKKLLRIAHTFSSWFMEIYGDFSYEPYPFVMPDDIRKQANYKELIAENETLAAELIKALSSKSGKIEDVRITIMQQLYSFVTFPA